MKQARKIRPILYGTFLKHMMQIHLTVSSGLCVTQVMCICIDTESHSHVDTCFINNPKDGDCKRLHKMLMNDISFQVNRE